MNISASLLLKYTKPILHQTPNSPRNHIKPLQLKLRLMYRGNFPVHKSITVFHRSERLCVIKIKKVNPQPSSPQHVWFTQYYSVNHLTEWDAALNFLWIQYIYIDRDDQTDRISLSQESSTQIKNKMSAAASSAVASSLYPYCITSGEPYPPKKPAPSVTARSIGNSCWC